MASRMEKYYNENFHATKRSQRNQFLYRENERLNDQHRSDIGNDLEEIFQKEKDYKKRQKILKETMLKDFDMHRSRYTYKRPITKQEDEKIKNLIQTIVMTSHKNQIRKLQFKKIIASQYQKTTNSQIDIAPEKNPISKLDSLFYKKINKNKEDQKLNLKLKRVVGIFFLLNSLLLFYLFYQLIK